MKIIKAKNGSRFLDSYPWSSAPERGDWHYDIARRWKAEERIAGFAGYLGHMTPAKLRALHDAGLWFTPVTVAGEYNDGAADEIAQLRALGIPAGAHVWLDVEGTAVWNAGKDPKKLAAVKDLIEAWNKDIRAAGYRPAMYVGVPQPFTSKELYAFSCERYWAGQGSVRDREGVLTEPFRDFANCRGWNAIQAAPSEVCGGVLIDFNFVKGDYKRDTFNVVAA